MCIRDSYYGGVKKYQWVTLPLALHGVIAKKDGTVIPVNIGEKPEDPVFGVSDLLIHLAADQMEKKASKVIEGEDKMCIRDRVYVEKSTGVTFKDVAGQDEAKESLQEVVDVYKRQIFS